MTAITTESKAAPIEMKALGMSFHDDKFLNTLENLLSFKDKYEIKKLRASIESLLEGTAFTVQDVNIPTFDQNSEISFSAAISWKDAPAKTTIVLEGRHLTICTLHMEWFEPSPPEKDRKLWRQGEWKTDCESYRKGVVYWADFLTTLYALKESRLFNSLINNCFGGDDLRLSDEQRRYYRRLNHYLGGTDQRFHVPPTLLERSKQLAKDYIRSGGIQAGIALTLALKEHGRGGATRSGQVYDHQWVDEMLKDVRHV